MRDNLEFLDIITILSFALQLNNRDMQGEIDKAVDDIHEHLKEQDKKLDMLLEGRCKDDL